VTIAYPHLAARIFNRPLLIQPAALDAILAGIAPRLLGQTGGTPAAAPMHADLFGAMGGQWSDNGYKVIDGVAVISAMGALVHRGRFDAATCTNVLGYDTVVAQAEAAAADASIRAIVTVWDSPGGEAAGAFEAHDRLLALRGTKPHIAVLDSMALSAGYLGACTADEIVISRTGHAGSVGVVMRHADLSRALEADGVAITHIYSGGHKIDGNPFEPLPDSVRADLQRESDGLYAMFIDAVATARRLDPDAVRNTQAAVFRGVAAVAAGLADRIGTLDQVISELAGSSRPAPVGHPARATATDTGETRMSGTTTPAGNDQPASVTQAALDAARAEGHAAGLQAGAEAERTRVSGILTHANAEGRTALAHQCITTGLSVDQAGAILGAAPVAATPSAAGNAFAAAMAGVKNPDVKHGSQGDDAAPDNTEAALAASIVGLIGNTRQ